MATKGRRSKPPLIEELRSHPYRFDFYQAVRLVELGWGRGKESPQSENKVAVGEGADPGKEAIQFHSDPSLEFPPSPIKSFTPGQGGTEKAHMIIRFIGLAGALGPLPRSYMEGLLKRVSRKDAAWLAFLDIFNHRLASFMVRIRKAHRVGLDIEAPHNTLIAKFLRSFIGLGTKGLQQRMSVEDRSLLLYAGLFVHHQRTVSGLRQLLSDYFGVCVEVRQFAGEWIYLEDGQETRLGSQPGINNRLGRETVLGTRYWDQQSGLELVIGPLEKSTFLRFLPNGDQYHPLRSLVLFYVTPQFNFRVRLVAKPDAFPTSQLNGSMQLGWTSWLRLSDAETTDDQVLVQLRNNQMLDTA